MKDNHPQMHSPHLLAQNQVPISLIITVRNEAASLPRLLNSILAQSTQPAEIIITNGGSTDGTQEIVTSYMDRLPLRLIELPGANISQGRNAAIQNATHSIIAATDAGVRLDPHWLQELTRPLVETRPTQYSVLDTQYSAVSGFFLPDPQTPFEIAMAATVLPALADIDPQTFLPSSRSIAFHKEAWAQAGGYPEWLDYCEDLVFDIRLKEITQSFQFAPQAIVYFRPRSNLRSFFLQYYRYARGDGKADLWRKRHAIRYLTYIATPIVTLWAWRHHQRPSGKSMMILIILTGAAYCRRPYARLLAMLQKLPAASQLYVLALVPVIRLTGDVAKMAGYPVGVWWRLKNKPTRRQDTL